MSSKAQSELYRRLPSVDELLRAPELAAAVEREGHATVTDAARAVLARVRDEIAAERLDNDALELAVRGLTDAVERELRRSMQYSLCPVINATGVILHTNLGRAPIGERALDHVREVASRYSNLEFDVAAGERGKRDVHVHRLFTKLFAAVRSDLSTIVVNNNAAAVLLMLNSLAEGGEVIVSRGELVEIGGSFRIPDVMAKSGAVLREVGTTNRTRVADYERAMSDRTRAILRVHRSNFQIVGFSEQPSLAELVAVGQSRNIPVIEDLGSGALFDLRSIGVAGEPSVSDSLAANVDVVTYSGDKLLGGPQAGIITGRKELIARMRSNPLFRALRVDKLTYAALEATLLAYVRERHDDIPALRMMRVPAEQIRERAEAMVRGLRGKLHFKVVGTQSVIGGGAAPGATLPSFALSIARERSSADELAAMLRAGNPPIVARVEENRVLLDLRTVFADQDASVVEALTRLS
jgi:L-seryl-tRNA(Ser) seleniumtransferase